MVQHAVADHDCFVTRINSDVNVQSERDKSADHIFHKCYEAVVAFVEGDFLVSPRRKRVGGCPQQMNTEGVQDFFYLGQFAAEVVTGFLYGLADFCVDFDVALHEFRLDGILQGFGQGRQHLVDTAFE